jgi:hypothetical protein
MRAAAALRPGRDITGGEEEEEEGEVDEGEDRDCGEDRAAGAAFAADARRMSASYSMARNEAVSAFWRTSRLAKGGGVELVAPAFAPAFDMAAFSAQVARAASADRFAGEAV